MSICCDDDAVQASSTHSVDGIPINCLVEYLSI